MKSLFAFMRKEITEHLRSGRFLVLIIVFTLFGIMNPAIAKLTPWLFEMLSESLAESGLSVGAVSVDAAMSWTQFFKNIPMGLIVFVLLEGGIFTKEYESGTLVLALTKGLERRKVIVSKALIMALLWSICYWLCYGITYAYNAYFWDNSIMHSLAFAAMIWWLFGLWTVMLIVLFSSMAKQSSAVYLGTGGTVLIAYVINLFPKLSEYSPAHLMDIAPLTAGIEEPSAYTTAVIISAVLCLVSLAASIPIFNRKQI